MPQNARVVQLPSAAFRIEQADNLSFMRSLPNESVQLVVTSPPYNIGKSYETREDMDTYLSQQAKTIAEAVRVLKPQGSIAWQVGNHIATTGEVIPLDAVLYPLFKNHDLKLRNRIIWHFEHGLHSRKRLSGRHETILWFTKSDEYVFNLDPIRVPSKYPLKKHFKGPNKGQLSGNPLGKNPSDVWVIPNVKANHPEKTSHPAQFPVELVERLVLALSNAGDQVLDPYLGSGTSVIAALRQDRIGLGCDVMQPYVDLALSRVRQHYEGSLRVREMGKPVWNPALPGGGHR